MLRLIKACKSRVFSSTRVVDWNIRINRMKFFFCLYFLSILFCFVLFTVLKLTVWCWEISDQPPILYVISLKIDVMKNHFSRVVSGQHLAVPLRACCPTTFWKSLLALLYNYCDFSPSFFFFVMGGTGISYCDNEFPCRLSGKNSKLFQEFRRLPIPKLIRFWNYAIWNNWWCLARVGFSRTEIFK